VKSFLPKSYVELLSQLYAGVRAGSTKRATNDAERVPERAPRSLAEWEHRSASW